MYAKYERRVYRGGALVWGGQYRNLSNLPHWHKECEIICVQKGEAKVNLDNVDYQLKEGECIFCPSETIHNITSSQNSLLAVALFDKPLTGDVTDVYHLLSPTFRDNYNIGETILKIRDEYASSGKFYGLFTNSLITTLVLTIFREEPIEEIHKDEKRNPLDSYKKLLARLEKSPDLSFEDATEFMNMSPAYFSRYFKKISGMTYSKYLNAVRVEKAIDLMYKNPRLTSRDLMVQTGFGTLRNFNRVFKEITGYTPRSLPDSYVSTIRISLQDEEGRYDPTLEESELLRATQS